jgi:hypothetical protein
VDALTKLMDDLMVQARAAVASGADNEEALRAAVDFSAHDAAIAGDDPMRAFLFDIWFKKPIIESAFIEATGGTVKQPTTTP